MIMMPAKRRLSAEALSAAVLARNAAAALRAAAFFLLGALGPRLELPTFSPGDVDASADHGVRTDQQPATPCTVPSTDGGGL